MEFLAFVKDNQYQCREVGDNFLICYANAPVFDSVEFDESGDLLVSVGSLFLKHNDAGIIAYDKSQDSAWQNAYNKFLSNEMPPAWVEPVINVEEQVILSHTFYVLKDSNGNITKRSKTARGLLDPQSETTSDVEAIISGLLQSIQTVTEKISEAEEDVLMYVIEDENSVQWKLLNSLVIDAQKALAKAEQALQDHIKGLSNPHTETVSKLTDDKINLIQQLSQFLPK